MPKKPRSLTSPAAFAALGLAGALSLTGCAGGSSSPEDLFKQYVEALSEGDYEQALSMVADTGEITPENIYNFTDFEFKEPLLRGESLNSDAESGTIGMDVNGVPVPVQVEKRNGQWKLSNPVLLAPFDFTEQFATYDKFEEVGTVSFIAENGDEITQPAGFTVVPQGEESGQRITVSLTGNLVPDQNFEASLSALSDGWPTDEFDPGQLPEKVAAIADDLAYVDWHYDVGTQQYITQKGALSGVACTLGELGNKSVESSSDFLFVCSFDKPEKDLDGAEFFRPAMSDEEGGALETTSKFDNKGGISVRDFLPCIYNTGLSIAPGESGGDFEVLLKDGKLTVLWKSEERADAFSGEFQRLDEPRISETCSGWDPAKEGNITEGLVPRDSDAEGTTVSLKL